ncbi:MAG TPA: NCS1 family nucleobase:cation symporter-1 [Coleofasciculaceae cyanobacterium]
MYDAELTNHDLQPVPPERRTWTTLNFMALWIGMCICIPSYMIASSLIEGGMNVSQALMTVFLGNVIVLIPMILNGHVGVKYGIPFPIYARLSFGVQGANIPALLRAIVACGWFGIQCWIGGTAIFTMLTAVWPEAAHVPAMLPAFMGVKIVPFLCFLVFWGINLLLIHKGIESIKKLETFCAPLLVLSGIGLLFWAGQAAGGFTGMLAAPSKFKTSAEFWAFFVPSLTGMVGFWATLSLNIPDFTRYAQNQRAQVLGQALGLPTTMTLIAFIGVAVTSASFGIFGERIWDPIMLVGKFDNPFIIFLAMLLICIATLAMNVAANVVAPANDFANLAPTKIDFKRGGTLTAIIGLLIMPWKLIADPSGYIFTWLVGYSALLGPVAGILLTDYFWVRKSEINVDDLYRKQGLYTYCNGYNPVAVIALAAGVLPNIPGFLVQIKALDAAVVPPFFTELYHYAWFVGLALAGLVYVVLMKPQAKTLAPVEILPEQPEAAEVANAGD